MFHPTIQPSFQDNVDFENAERGLVASLDTCLVRNKDGQMVWNNEDYNFLQGDCPPTVNPKLWRQGRLTRKQGLFEVTNGVYQVRGFDISNMTLVEGKTGVIVLDVLASTECATAALRFYRSHRGDRSVKAVIYSHSHYDHFGGAQGVLSEAIENQQEVPIIAPTGFMDAVLKENIVAGPAMRRRAVFMFGGSLPIGPKAHVGCGLGMAASSGTTVVVPPNDTIDATGDERIIDGVRLVFQMVPETEAPCEINVFFPNQRAVYIAECATHTMHNVITLRGAQVRDAKKWSKHLDETLNLYGHDSDVILSGHHWPTWGHENIVKFISDQRDVYSYMHDQTVRLMNKGMSGVEIAEQLQLPPSLQQEWYAGEYYGCLSQNVKGIYQRYMTWFDGNPANLWKHQPKEEGKRYVDCMGGVQAVLEKAKEFADKGDLRFAATLLDHVVAAEPSNEQGQQQQLAAVYERLGFGAENAVWRNFYLTAALELGSKSKGAPQSVIAINPQSTVEDWFDALSLQIDGPKACNMSVQTIVINIPDEQTTWTLTLRNGTLTYRSKAFGTALSSDSADLTVTISKNEVYDMIAKGNIDVVKKTGKGKIEIVANLLNLCNIVTC
ncbi:beta-lactamase-like protein [Hyaloscypha variabilis F]|uniref:Beta-lactamase-like protein n=1 Tax=Hyaloscypha variabilis (strain UAMH 11265 / GT02V1 / F) TaxID=1149755 RepID=A0A2J6RLZ2_HYAVF|nr:beta-lactamase-like protein [Hyaloscypha variabilis F]